MDENKIIPETDNVTNTDELQPEAESVAEKTVTNESEPAEEVAVAEVEPLDNADSEDSADAETEEADAEIVDTEDTENSEKDEESQQVQDVAPKKKKRKGLKIVLGILGGLLLSFVALIVVAIIYSNNLTKLSVDADEPAITIDGTDIAAGEYLYMYSYYSSYYSYYYTPEQVEEYATKQLVYVNSLYKKAVEKNYTLSEEDYADIDEVLASVETQAEAYSVTVEEMLEDYYFCEGYTLDMFKAYLEKEFLANKYYADVVADVQDKYTGDSGLALIEAEYNKNKTDYDLTKASYVYFDATEDDTQSTVDAIIAKVNAGTSFKDAVAAVAKDAEIKSLNGFTKSVVETKLSEKISEWLFDIKDGTYVNASGAVTSVTEGDVVYVVYADTEPYKDIQIPVTLAYIQVKADTDTTIKSESELLLDAKTTASHILKDFEATKKTATDFASLIDTYNKGENKLVSGDHYEGIVNDGTYDAALADWAFDAERKVDDYALVAGDGCYYVVFFEAKADNEVWYQTIYDTLVNADITDWSTEVTDSYKDKTVEHEEVIDAVITYVTANSSSSSY